MKIILGILSVLVLSSVKAQVVSDWESPQTIGINKEQTTATFSSYANEKDSLLYKQPDSEKTLNGKWKFKWVAKPEQRPKYFYKSDFLFFGSVY